MMKQLVILGLFVLFLAAVQYAKAQTADDVIEKHIKARGGREKLAALQTVYMEGSREIMGNEASVKVYKQQGKLSRSEFEVGSNSGFNLITDQGGWNYFSMRGEVNKMPDQAHAAQLTELDIQGPLMDYAAKGHKVELLGKETRDNIECVRLKLTTSTGREITYWLNGSTFLIHQTSTKGGAMGGGGGRNPDAETLTTYSDYQEIDGIKFPLTVDITIVGGQGRGGGNTTFDKIEVNKPIDAKLFKPE